MSSNLEDACQDRHVGIITLILSLNALVCILVSVFLIAHCEVQFYTQTFDFINLAILSCYHTSTTSALLMKGMVSDQ